MQDTIWKLGQISSKISATQSVFGGIGCDLHSRTLSGSDSSNFNVYHCAYTMAISQFLFLLTHLLIPVQYDSTNTYYKNNNMLCLNNIWQFFKTFPFIFFNSCCNLCNLQTLYIIGSRLWQLRKLECKEFRWLVQRHNNRTFLLLLLLLFLACDDHNLLHFIKNLQ